MFVSLKEVVYGTYHTLGVGWHISPGDVGVVGVMGLAIGVRGDDGGSTALTVMPSFRRSNV